MMSNIRIRQELIKHGATSRQANIYCGMVSAAVRDSKGWGGIVNYHHVLPVNCGWWKRFAKAKWNLVPLAWSLHVSLHAYLVFMFPCNMALRRALKITLSSHTAERCDEKKYRMRNQICFWYQQGHNASWIGRQVGTDHHTIINWLHEWGIKTRSYWGSSLGPLEFKHKKQILAWYRGGKSEQWMARQLGFTVKRVDYWLHKWGVFQAKGRNNARAKKLKYKKQIIAWYRGGKTTTQIAKQTGLCDGTIGKWLKECGVRLSPYRYAPTRKYKKQIISWVRAGKSTPWIGNKLGLAATSIFWGLRRWGVSAAGRSGVLLKKPQYKQRIIAWYQAGKTSTWIGARVGLHHTVIIRWLREWNIPIRKTWSTRTQAFKTRMKVLETDHKAQILTWYRAGWTLKKLAKRFHLSDAVIGSQLQKWGIARRSMKAEMARRYPKKLRYKDHILSWKAQGKSFTWIGKRLNVSGRAIGQWVREYKTL